MSKGEVQLVPLSLDDAMKVRVWRNSSAIRPHMDYQEVISEEQQKEWFSELDSNKERYFTIYLEQEPIGLIHLNKIAFDERTAYAGLFIGEENYQGTGVAYWASLNILDHAFYDLKLDKVFAKVSETNHEAISYNKSLGFELAGKEKSGFVKMLLSSRVYKQKRNELLNILGL